MTMQQLHDAFIALAQEAQKEGIRIHSAHFDWSPLLFASSKDSAHALIGVSLDTRSNAP